MVLVSMGLSRPVFIRESRNEVGVRIVTQLDNYGECVIACHDSDISMRGCMDNLSTTLVTVVQPAYAYSVSVGMMVRKMLCQHEPGSA